MPGWDRFPIRDAFAGEYAAPVFVDNDVNVMALGEHWGGVGKGLDNMLFVKIGTRIGGGVIADGRLYRGTQGCAGDIGHICVGTLRVRSARAATEGASKPWPPPPPSR